MVSTDSQTAMDAARKAVLDFMQKNGHADTTVHERVAPAIFHETISYNEHENVTTVVDRELFQDHYHLSIQPVTDNETLDEQHKDNVLPIETRTFEHDDREEVQRRLDAEHAKFRDHVERVDGEHTQTLVPVIAGERIHHHVHEVIQPVVNKHTVEPHVVHTVVQIHEIHRNAAQHHLTAALPAVSMAEFKKQGGVLTGREERFDFFEGSPRNVGGTLGTAHDASAASLPGAAGAANQLVHPNEQNVAAQHTATATAPAVAPSAPATQHTGTTQAPNTDKPLPTPSAVAVTQASKLGEGPLQSTQAGPQASQGQGQSQSQAQGQPQAATPGGRWSLLPLTMVKTAGDATLGHQPIRAPLRPAQAHAGSAAAPTTAVDGRQVSVAKPGQDQQPRRPS